jgi:flagellar hook protein FlgE
MSILSTLQTARTAIDFYSDRLSLIGTNIASMQTPGYDRQRQLPADTFYQQLTAMNAAGGTATAGGVREAGRESIHTVGELAATDQSTDIAINGRGFFPVRDTVSGRDFYTRVGSFDLDDEGFLRLTTGQALLGIQGPPPAFQVSLDAQQKLVFSVDPSSAGATPGTDGGVLQLQAEGARWDAGTLSFADAAAAGGRTFPTLADGSLLTASVFDATLADLAGGRGLDPGLRYASFAELEGAIARNGVSVAQADAALRAVTGEAGLSLAGGTFRTATELRAALDGGVTTLAEIDAALATLAPDGLQPAWARQEDLRAGLAAGLFTEADLDLALAATPLTLGGDTFDGSAGRGWSDLVSVFPVNPGTGQPYSLAEIEEAAPRPLGLQVQPDGTVQWQFSNGTKAPAAWLRLADVRNLATLQPGGENLFVASPDTVLLGDWQTNAPGVGGRGPLAGGYLEMSNVDLTAEFGDLLASQRSYQASSRMLGVMDELLSTVIQLRR